MHLVNTHSDKQIYLSGKDLELKALYIPQII